MDNIKSRGKGKTYDLIMRCMGQKYYIEAKLSGY